LHDCSRLSLLESAMGVRRDKADEEAQRFGPVRQVPLAEVVYEDQWSKPYRDH
jgi:hypothetical protein